jgi:hypothetical protein
MNVLKATVLKNEGSATSSEELKQIGIKTMLKHLDSTKYYRIKVDSSVLEIPFR